MQSLPVKNVPQSTLLDTEANSPAEAPVQSRKQQVRKRSNLQKKWALGSGADAPATDHLEEASAMSTTEYPYPCDPNAVYEAEPESKSPPVATTNNGGSLANRPGGTVAVTTGVVEIQLDV